MYVKILTFYQVSKSGTLVNLAPGDWYDMGKQEALRLIAQGIATVPGDKMGELFPANSAIHVLKRLSQKVKDAMKTRTGLPVKSGKLKTLPATYTCILDGELDVPDPLVGAGLSLLERFDWEVLAPLKDYRQMAMTMGTASERALTETATLDLRIPAFDSRLLFVKRSDAGQALVDCWIAEQDKGQDNDLAFLRAVWTVKPLICALPVNWTTRGKDE